MIVNRKKIIKAVEASGKFRDKGNSITPILQLVKIDPEKGEVSATDLEAYAVSYFKANDFDKEKDGFCCDAPQLIGLMGMETDEDIEIVLADDKRSISVGKNFSDMPATDTEEFPDVPDVTGTMEFLFSITKKQIMALTCIGCPGDEKRDHIVGVYFSGEKGRAASTDIKRLNMVTIPDAVKHEPFTISKKQLGAIACLSKEKVDVHEINGMYMFTTDNDVDTGAIIHSLEGEFPVYEDLMKKHDTVIVFSKDELIPACQKAIQMMSNEFAGCIYDFNGELKMNISNPMKGTYEGVVPYKAPSDCPEIKMALNSKFMLDAIKNLDGDDVEFSIKGSGDDAAHVTISAPGDDKNINLIMPMKI